MKRILITGSNSYIGLSVEQWLAKYAGDYETVTLDMMGDGWKSFDFSGFDTVFHVAGIAHDTGKKKDSDLYYLVNRDLAIGTATKAKESGVKQFIFMSSMLVYNGVKDRNITANTQPKVKGCYGDSKLQADLALQAMNSEAFHVAILRPPMIFGPGCKGNFPRLVSLAKKTPIFPKFKNRRSMLFIDNLCEFVRFVIDRTANGVFFPQNPDYFCTTDIVKQVASIKGKKIWFTRLFNWLIYLCRPLMGSVGKLFGNLTYDKSLSVDIEEYHFVDNGDSIKKSIEL